MELDFNPRAKDPRGGLPPAKTIAEGNMTLTANEMSDQSSPSLGLASGWHSHFDTVPPGTFVNAKHGASFTTGTFQFATPTGPQPNITASLLNNFSTLQAISQGFQSDFHVPTTSHFQHPYLGFDIPIASSGLQCGAINHLSGAGYLTTLQAGPLPASLGQPANFGPTIQWNGSLFAPPLSPAHQLCSNCQVGIHTNAILPLEGQSNIEAQTGPILPGPFAHFQTPDDFSFASHESLDLPGPDEPDAFQGLWAEQSLTTSFGAPGNREDPVSHMEAVESFTGTTSPDTTAFEITPSPDGGCSESLNVQPPEASYPQTANPTETSTPVDPAASTTKTKNTHPCGHCPTIFPTRSALRRHFDKATKPYPCPHPPCPFRGASPRDVNRHLTSKKHSNQGGAPSTPASRFHCSARPCRFADEGFARFDHYQRHMRTRHGIQVAVLGGRARKDSSAAASLCRAARSSTGSPA